MWHPGRGCCSSRRAPTVPLERRTSPAGGPAVSATEQEDRDRYAQYRKCPAVPKSSAETKRMQALKDADGMRGL